MLKSEGLVQADQGLQSALLVNGSVVLAEEVIEEFSGRPGNNSHDVHETEDNRGHGGTNGQSVANAYRLGDDLTEDDWHASDVDNKQ